MWIIPPEETTMVLKESIYVDVLFFYVERKNDI